MHRLQMQVLGFYGVCPGRRAAIGRKIEKHCSGEDGRPIESFSLNSKRHGLSM